MTLAPLRGVTTRTFRLVFAEEIASAGFSEAVTPFVSAAHGVDPLRDRELKGGEPLPVVPQFIGKDPAELRRCLKAIRGAGWAMADLNCGCPFPMVRRKGRGSGLLRNPDLLARMLDAGCEAMGDGMFSAKARLGVDSPGELLALMPVLNRFPLRRLVVHARTAVQMYSGECDTAAFERVAAQAAFPVVYNGDAPLSPAGRGGRETMVGRAFVRSLGAMDNSRELLLRYIDASCAELSGDGPVLGRMKELVSYWTGSQLWRRLWPAVKMCRTVAELRMLAT